MKLKLKAGLLAGIMVGSVLLQNCGSDDPAPKEDVYLAGWIDDGETNYSVISIKNDVQTIIGGGEIYESPNDISVDGSDVYVAGYNGYTDIIYWKNGERVLTPKDPDLAWEEIQKIIVRDGKKYFLAYGPGGFNAYRYYVDDVRKILPTQGDAVEMDVSSNGDVYVVGRSNEYHAVYWKNGVMKELYDGDSGATDVTIVGSDVYILGWYMNEESYPVPVMWKNEVMTEIGEEQGYYTSKLCVSGNDVYAIGNRTLDDAVVMWKNGEPLTLETEDHPISRAFGLEAKNGNIYFLTRNETTRNALLFKNGELMAPYDGTFEGELYGIDLK